jgi:probable HAF family extracellular repeat protein
VRRTLSRPAGVLFAAAFTCAASAATQYGYQDLGQVLDISQINRAGDVVGDVNERCALFRQSTGQWEQLLDKAHCAVTSLNNLDVAAGQIHDGRGKALPRAVLFKGNNKVRPLDANAYMSFASVIRSDGTIYGASQPTAGGQPYAYSWLAGQLTKLPAIPGFEWTWPVAATKSGIVAGNGQPNGFGPMDCPAQPAVLQNGTWTMLGNLGGSCAWVGGMNDLGDIVGGSFYAGDKKDGAFLWHDGVMTDLGSVNGGGAEAADINAAGTIIGMDFDAQGNAHGFVYANGTMSMIDNLVPSRPADLHFFEPVSINEPGQILTWGTSSLGVHAYVLTPLP